MRVRTLDKIYIICWIIIREWNRFDLCHIFHFIFFFVVPCPTDLLTVTPINNSFSFFFSFFLHSFYKYTHTFPIYTIIFHFICILLNYIRELLLTGVSLYLYTMYTCISRSVYIDHITPRLYHPCQWKFIFYI